jgi:hypothetical protein
MGHPCGVGGDGVKGRRKGLVGVAVFNGQQGALYYLVLKQVDF